MGPGLRQAIKSAVVEDPVNLYVLALGLATHLAWANHITVQDFQYTTYLRFLTGGEYQGGDLDKGRVLAERLRGKTAPWLSRLAVALYVWQLGNRPALLDRLNPPCAAYVARHRATMRWWALLGNAPHMDLMVLAAVTDHFQVYFLVRIIGFTGLAIALLLWERRISAAPLLVRVDGTSA